MKYNSIFVVNAESWILKFLGNDILEGFSKMGYECSQGSINEYKGEDICFHMWWRESVPVKRAKINAVFITHTDDILKEDELYSIKDKFDFFFSMSQEDRLFLIELGFDEKKVFGFNLPVRNKYIRPLKFGIFSNCYRDSRKNEEWLLDYCKSNNDSRLVVFTFIGAGWSDFVNKLSSLGCSFQWINISMNMPYEYMYQQLELSKLDYYIYMGMDGGAMGSYDAYAMGLELCISDDGYHKGIPDQIYSFTNKQNFFEQLDKIILKQKHKIEFFDNNTTENYVSRIVKVFEGDFLDEIEKSSSYINYSVLEKRRKNYFPIKKVRLLDHFWIKFVKYKQNRMQKH